MTEQISRRTFVKTGATVAAGVAVSLASPRAHGANERIRLSVVGVGNRGGQLITMTRPNEDIEIVAICDVYQPHLDKWKAELGGNVATYRDFRKMLESPDVDAVMVATPEHWHAIITIQACKAGKDVYVEKPLCYTIREGRRMVEAANETKRVVQVGLQRRSSPLFAGLREQVQANKFGKITMMRAYRLTNMFPKGLGKSPDSDPPADLDWDMWLGPKPMRPFNPDIAPYKFRWWKEYSSQLGNWGVHYFDLLRWITGDDAPSAAVALGGIYAVDDNRTIPDTMQAVYEFKSGRLMLFGQYEASGTPMFPYGESEMRGTEGTLYINDGGYKVVGEKPGQFQEAGPRAADEEIKKPEGDVTKLHIRNFLDCIKSRAVPNYPLEEGHRSTIFSHLGNIARATKTKLDWDADAEKFINNDAANAMLHYEYRSPWELG